MTLSERFPDFGKPVIIYAPFKGKIGIFEVTILGAGLATEHLGFL